MKHLLIILSILLTYTTAYTANTYTQGTIGGKQINLQTNQYGYTTGNIDGKQVYIHTTPNGYTNGTIGG